MYKSLFFITENSCLLMLENQFDERKTCGPDIENSKLKEPKKTQYI